MRGNRGGHSYGNRGGYRGAHFGSHGRTHLGGGYTRGYSSYGGHGYGHGYGIALGAAVGYLFGYGLSHRYDHSHNPTLVVVERPAQGATQTVNGQQATCLQEREYTTTVIIGGKEAEAYGTACLQPDGTWLRGPAKLVPEY